MKEVGKPCYMTDRPGDNKVLSGWMNFDVQDYIRLT
jgi:hypothetical protein